MSGAYIAVIGPADASEAETDLARRVGALLARRGAVVISGGLGGVMSASCEGATSAGGTSVGLLPGPDRATANEFVTIALPTALGQLRNGLVVNAADGVIAIGGSWGTLSEIALARRAGRPVVGLHSWQATSPTGSEPPLVVAESAEHAVNLVFSML